MSDIDNTSIYLHYIYSICTAYVLLNILYQLWRLSDLYILPKFRQAKDFKSYGQWAVITGSTDGIGKEFAKELARKGVDICLISRNEDKLKNTAKEIEEHFGVKTKYIVADFKDGNVYSNIKKNLADLDIGILVNNVGMAQFEAYSYHSEEIIKNYINVNLLSALMMTSVVLPCLISKKKGLIINISAVLGKLINPYSIMYNSTKTSLIRFGESLSYELSKHNIEVKNLTPGYVPTLMTAQFPNISKFLKYLPIPVLTTAKIYVQSAIRNLNFINNTSCGYFYHELELVFGSILPVAIFTQVIKFLHTVKRL